MTSVYLAVLSLRSFPALATAPLTGDQGMGSAKIGIIVGVVLLVLLALLTILKKLRK